MQKPYLRKFGSVSGISIWIVDGVFVRNNIDIDFTNFGQHYKFRFIPRNEFWIDKEFDEGEIEFYIDHLLVEYKLMSKGVSYSEALQKADRVERSERVKSAMMLVNSKSSKSDVIKSIRLKNLRKYSSKVNVFLIDGELVRDFFRIDFTEGGHDKVYSFVPDNEIWIDNDLGPSDRKFVILHELIERSLMAKGKAYHAAHRFASGRELYARKHPSRIDSMLKKASSMQ